jgi:hypothetical protein
LYAAKKQVGVNKRSTMKLTDCFLSRIIGDRIALYEQIVMEMGLWPMVILPKIW